MISIKNKIRFGVSFILILLLTGSILDFPGIYNKGIDIINEKLNLKFSHIFSVPYHLGLDLQGGSQLIYEADSDYISKIPVTEREDAILGVRDVIERRINVFGVSEPLVQTSKSQNRYRIIVELAGVYDINKAIQMIGETPILQFKTQSTTTPQLTPDEQKTIDDYNIDAEKKANEILIKVSEPISDFEKLAKEFSEDPGSKDKGGNLGWLKRGVLVPEFEKVCFDELTDGQINTNLIKTEYGFHIIKRMASRDIVSNINSNVNINNNTNTNLFDFVGTTTDNKTPLNGEKEYQCQHILIRTKNIYDIRPELVYGNWQDTQLSGEQLKNARVEFDPQTGVPTVALTFDKDGEKLFEDITRENVGKPVAIFLDGQPISSPIVQEVISGGSAIISGSFTINEAKLLAQRLNAGALRVPVKLISQQTVGATLGNISVQKSITSALYGLFAVLVFMLIFYRIPGFAADVSLIIYGLITLAIFKLIPVTVTLAGIAGFILSIGMAVDANILIFERMKEEIKRGLTLDMAIDEGFKRAWPSIRDGNYTTLITSLLLIWFSTSIVKGFAITLSIGLIVSIFSSMILSKIMLKFLARTRLSHYKRLFQ